MMNNINSINQAFVIEVITTFSSPFLISLGTAGHQIRQGSDHQILREMSKMEL